MSKLVVNIGRDYCGVAMKLPW